MPTTGDATGTETIEGRLCHPPRYFKDGFLIGKLEGPDQDFTIKGNFIEPAFGERYTMTGRWETHDKHGRQFSVESYTLHLPSTEDGIMRFLTQSLNGIGPVTAEAMTDAFERKTLSIIREDPIRVAAEIKGVTEKMAREWATALAEMAEMAEVQVQIETMLAGHLGPRAIKKILQRYRLEAPTVIKANPYRLIEIAGIGFPTADQIAVGRLGYPRRGGARQLAATMHAMDVFANDGHTTTTRVGLSAKVGSLLGTGDGPGEGGLEPLVHLGKQDIQTPRLYSAEMGIARRLADLMGGYGEDTPLYTGHIEDKLADDQIPAAQIIAESPVSILTGPPGTGKTYLLARLVEAQRYPPMLAAPTGKAAKRMGEALDRLGAARTIHSLLGGRPKDGGGWIWTKTRNNPLDTYWLILDEVSMVDTALLSVALDAVPDGARVTLVGDPNQLPSVGAGAVLRDLLASGRIPHAELKTIKRNSGRIVAGCHSLIAGQMPATATMAEAFPAGGDPNSDLNLIGVNTKNIQATIPKLLDYLQQTHGFDPLADVQVMSPLNDKGEASCKPLNELLQRKYVQSAKFAGFDFGLGDKVICRKNGTVKMRDGDDTTVVNGDFGRVTGLDTVSKALIVQHFFPDRFCLYKVHEARNALRLAYAVTVHKMQGSSAPVVIIPCHRSAAGSPVWTRELIYTAISRAEKYCFLVGTPGLIEKAIGRRQIELRRSDLVSKLHRMIPGEGNDNA